MHLEVWNFFGGRCLNRTNSQLELNNQCSLYLISTSLIYEAWGTILLKNRQGFWILVCQYCGKKLGLFLLDKVWNTVFTSVCSVGYQMVVLLHNSQYKSHHFWPSLNNALCFKDEALQFWNSSLPSSPLICCINYPLKYSSHLIISWINCDVVRF